MDRLAEIMAWKRKEIAPRLRRVTETELSELDSRLAKPRPFGKALRRADGELAIIAEIKRRSPSAGDIKTDLDAGAQAQSYHSAGADALSVLTDKKFFGGALEDLAAASRRVRLPCLRKDFMVHPIQVLEAREAGASAILLIVRALDDEEIRTLRGAAQAAGLDALFEVHDELELERAINHGAEIVGVNNRDLAAFTTDVALSERLIPRIPRSVTAVSESGICVAADATRVREAGAHAVLVGEALMKAAHPESLIRSFRSG